MHVIKVKPEPGDYACQHCGDCVVTVNAFDPTTSTLTYTFAKLPDLHGYHHAVQLDIPVAPATAGMHPANLT